jgi:hypothetical protein
VTTCKTMDPFHEQHASHPIGGPGGPDEVLLLLESISNLVADAFVRVSRLVPHTANLKRGQFGCIAWNPQLAVCLAQTISDEHRKGLAVLIDRDATSSEKTCKDLGLLVAKMTIERMPTNGRDGPRLPPFVGTGATRTPELLACLIVHGRLMTPPGSHNGESYASMVSYIRAGIARGILDGVIPDTPEALETTNRVDTLVSTELERTATRDASVVPPEGILLVMPSVRATPGSLATPTGPLATDAVAASNIAEWSSIRAFLQATTSPEAGRLPALSKMLLHLNRIPLREGTSIISVFATETSTNALVLDAAALFAYFAFDVAPDRTKTASFALSVKMVVAAVGDEPKDPDSFVTQGDMSRGGRFWDGEMGEAVPELVGGGIPSWVVRGICSRNVAMFTGLSAIVGQSSKAVAFWRLVGWRLERPRIAALLNEPLVEERGGGGSDTARQQQTVLLRLASLCLHTQTHVGAMLLHLPPPPPPPPNASHEREGFRTLYDLAWTSYANGMWPSTWCDPLSIFRKRLGRTITLLNSITQHASGLSDTKWTYQRRREDRRMADTEGLRPLASKDVVDDSDAEGAADDVRLLRRFFEAIANALKRWSTLPKTIQPSVSEPTRIARMQLQTSALGLPLNDDAVFVQACLEAALSMTEAQIRGSGWSTTMSLPITSGRLMRNGPSFPIIPPLEDAVLPTDDAIRTGARLVYDLMHAVRMLLQDALSTRVPGASKGSTQSAIDPRRFIALVLVSHTRSGARQVAFARLIGKHASTAYMPSMGSTTVATEFPAPHVVGSTDQEEILDASLLPHNLFTNSVQASILDGELTAFESIAAAMVNGLQTATEENKKLWVARYRLAQTLFHSKEGSVQADTLQRLRSLTSDVASEEVERQFDGAFEKLKTFEWFRHCNSNVRGTGPTTGCEIDDREISEHAAPMTNELLDALLGGDDYLTARPASFLSRDAERNAVVAYNRQSALAWMASARPLDLASRHVIGVLRKVGQEGVEQTMWCGKHGMHMRTATIPLLFSWIRPDEAVNRVPDAADEPRLDDDFRREAELALSAYGAAHSRAEHAGP